LKANIKAIMRQRIHIRIKAQNKKGFLPPKGPAVLKIIPLSPEKETTS